jgi:hypothetical protein
MKQGDLDRILLSEKSIIPSPSFSTNVLAHIPDDAPPRRHLPSPWIPLLLSILVLAILGMLFLRQYSALRSVYPAAVDRYRWIAAPADPILKNTLLLAFASLLGTWMIIQVSLRLIAGKG